MLSTMQDDQLSLAYLLQYGARLHANAEVATWTGSGTRKSTFAQVGKRSSTWSATWPFRPWARYCTP